VENLHPGQFLTSGVLYRRIYPGPTCYREGKSTSQVFTKKREDPGISVNLASLTSSEDVLKGHDNFGLAEITVEEVIAAGFTVKYEPKKGDPGHCVIYGQFSDGNCRKLSRASKVLVAPNLAP